MGTPTPYQASSSQLADIQKKLLLDNKIRSGVGWFFWIAGLSILNTLIHLLGSNVTFTIGLGVTQIVDALMTAFIKDLGSGWTILRYIGIALDLGIAGVFIGLGILGRKRYRWAIILGMVLYAIDGIILLVFQSYLGAAFHLWALVGIGGSLNAIKELDILNKNSFTETVGEIRQRMPSI